MGLFGKMGCNSGSCHGSFQGKGGFRLSLFGYDPAKDYLALTRDLSGRRLNSVNPDDSLLLLKASGQVEHGGGRRFGVDSWQYSMFRKWIADGAKWTKGSGDVTGITITPPILELKPGQTNTLTVMAKFGDGSQENITSLCEFRVNDDAVAEMAGAGAVKGLRSGDTPVIVSYRGTVLPVRILVPMQAKPGFAYPKLTEVNYVDHEVFAKLRSLNIVPSDLASDAEFLRRLTIDTIGTLPTPEEVRAFLADTRPDKRARKIDELLEHPRHSALWATKLSDITGNNTDALENPVQLRPKRSQMWYDWLRKRMRDNTPYDEIIRGILTATSRDGEAVDEWIKQTSATDEEMTKGFDTPYAERKSLDLFWRRQQQVPVEQWGEKTAAAFLGIRLECAQCHKHPFDRWTQADYRGFANVFGQIRFDNQSSESRQAIAEETKKRAGMGRPANQQNQVREVYTGARRPALTHPDTGAPLSPKALGGPEIDTSGSNDARVAVFDWLRSPDNPFFARSFVNRIWGHYLGVGIVEPVDDFSLANPPSNDKLLGALARDFVERKFDIRHVERVILNSRTYQLSSRPNETNQLDRKNFSHSFVRPMLAEVVVDVLNDALGTKENWGNDVRPDSRAIEIGASRIANLNLNYIFRIFGRSPRSAACDCERALEPALPQKLFLMTDANILTKLQSGRVAQLASSDKTDEQVLEEMFLAVLGRFPTDQDTHLFATYRAARSDRKAVLVDTMWALINTREFILNH